MTNDHQIDVLKNALREYTDEHAVERKALIKEALHEWLEEKYAQWGRWTLSAFIAMLLGAFIYFILWTQGWHKP